MRGRRGSSGSARWMVPLALVIACLCLAASAQAAQVGINSDITWGTPSSDVNQEVSLTVQAGVPWIRATVDLSGAEYYGPQLNMSYLSSIDAAVQAARSAGLNVLLELDRTPYWASADPNKYTDSSGFHWNPYWKYTSPELYAQVVTDIVNHYKTMGVNAYEVWNEPNNPSFWPSGVSAADYAALLKAAFPAIKAADPSATVVMGGLENEGSYAFLQGMYSAGARGYYDVANFHIYPSGDPTQCQTSGGLPSVDSFCLLNGLRSVMTANGDDAPVWVTELGWSTCAQTWCVTPQQQAAYITSAYTLLASSPYSWVQKAFVYQTRDLYWDTSNSDWDSSLGVMTRTFAPKPAYYALQALAGGSSPQRAATVNKGAVASFRRGSVRLSLHLKRAARAGWFDAAGRLRARGLRSSTFLRFVKLILQRRIRGHWHTVRTEMVRLRKGNYARLVSVHPGWWRVWTAVANARTASHVIRIA